MPKQNKNTLQTTSSNSFDMSAVANGLAIALRTDEVSKGQHSSEYLRIAERSLFGEFNKRVTYTKGCVLGQELAGEKYGERTVALSLQMRKPDGSRQMVVFGRTPAELDPARGGRLPHDPKAGAPGEYMMAAFPMDSQGPASVRYLDEVELMGVRAAYGQQERDANGQLFIGLKPNPQRANAALHEDARQIRITGELEQCMALIDTRPLPELVQ
jgi:hypothetical protein